MGDENDTTLPPGAGNGLIDRRTLLTGSVALGAAFCLPRTPMAQKPDPMQVPGSGFVTYGHPSVHEKRTIRYSSTNPMAPGNGISYTPLHRLEGTIVPNGLHFERHHNGVPNIDPASHRLTIHGKVKRPLAFSIDALLRYPMHSRQCFVECGGNSNAGWNDEPLQTATSNIHGMVANSEWTGVPVAILLDEVGVDPAATWAVAEGRDAFALAMSVPVAKLSDDAMIALYQNGERIRPENGYPMRLLLPGYEGVTQVKWLHRLQLADQPAMARNETSRYTELQADGTARQFTLEMEVKSLITSPSTGMVLDERGLYEVKGLAWSGRGRIVRVEVSADGGKSWAEAALDGPVQPKCFTRFRLPWHWQGQAAVLKSRATDETGEVQPERDVLIAKRGKHGYFHYNAVVSYAVDEDGFVSHVYT
ncbi:MAG: sulfite dehydrogenase [Pseudomonadota bacterium]